MAIYKKGSKGAKVKEIQKALKAKGYYTIAIDGNFGKGTLAAVRKFQKNEGLAVDGIVGHIALMFDIKIQNGSISRAVKAEIIQAFNKLPKRLSIENIEVRKMRIIANKRAEASNPRWVEDVRTRKLCLLIVAGLCMGLSMILINNSGLDLRG